MNYIKHTNKEKKLLGKLGDFSKNMIQNHHLENLSEFIVHDICAKDTFNISKAAYLVNNPDFICLKGITGYHQDESFNIFPSWQSQQEFSSHMKNASFNSVVRAIDVGSIEITDDRKIQELAHSLQMRDPVFHGWNLKNDNHGIFIFERPEDTDEVQQYLPHFLQMLSFCSIF